MRLDGGVHHALDVFFAEEGDEIPSRNAQGLDFFPADFPSVFAGLGRHVQQSLPGPLPIVGEPQVTREGRARRMEMVKDRVVGELTDHVVIPRLADPLVLLGRFPNRSSRVK